MLCVTSVTDVTYLRSPCWLFSQVIQKRTRTINPAKLLRKNEVEGRTRLKSKEISEEGREFMRCSTEGFLYAYDGLFSLRNTHHPRQYIYTKWVEERQSKC